MSIYLCILGVEAGEWKQLKIEKKKKKESQTGNNPSTREINKKWYIRTTKYNSVSKRHDPLLHTTR